MEARRWKITKNLLIKIFFSTIFILFSGCKKSENKIVIEKPAKKDTVFIEKNLVHFVDNPKLDKEKVIIYKDDYYTISYSKNELNKIQKLFPYINSETPIFPDNAYSKGCFIDYIDSKGEKEHYSFGSEVGQDNYFVLYAYFLRQKNGEKFKKERENLIKIYRDINNIYDIVYGGGTAYGHDYLRILAYAEFSIFSGQNKSFLNENFPQNKHQFFNSLNEFAFKHIDSDDTNGLSNNDKNSMKNKILELIQELNNKITNNFYLRNAQKYEKENYIRE